jgi:hypothetical protein
MSYIEELRQSKNKAQVAFQEFALSTNKFANHLFCFFEGKDNSYYVPRIKRFTENYHPIKCGGRDKVLEIYHLITNRPEYKFYKKAFFIDKDFNTTTIPTNSSIFETPCYSVENFYTSTVSFKEILTNEFHISEVYDHVVFEKCLSVFEKRQQEFHDAVCLFNAWYACLIEVRNRTGIQTGVKLDDKLPSGFVLISLDSVITNYNLETLKAVFPATIEVESSLLDVKLNSFQNCDKRNVFRGKYEMQFLIKIIQLLIQDSNNAKTIFSTKINFAFGDNLSNLQALNVFEAYAETPKSLTDYLEMATK